MYFTVIIKVFVFMDVLVYDIYTHFSVIKRRRYSMQLFFYLSLSLVVWYAGQKKKKPPNKPI